MRNALAAAFPLLLALASTAAQAQSSDPGRDALRQATPFAEGRLTATRLANGTAAETTWVGHRSGQTGNYWEVGVGPRRPGISPDGLWNFETTVHGDSLQGWWPIRLSFGTGKPVSDVARSWWGLDYGNVVNSVLSAAPAHQRSTGVVGVWHRDRGNGEGAGVTWTPIAGTASAWCGLRRHGDLAELDPLTGNPFNQSVAERTTGGETAAGGASSRSFPGYGDQWDQMLYRDVPLNDADSLAISFRYVTRMSSAYDSAASTRAGWFDKDPLSTATGNFISSTAAGADAPRDSFMVYAGAPADEGACRYSDGSTVAIFDPLRRWFSEVLRVNEPGVPYVELLSRAGDVPLDTLSGDTAFAATLSNGVIQPILDAQPGPGGIVRLVFRVKTNSLTSDQTGGATYSSASRGAAILDEVAVNSAVIGAFESPDDVDDRASVPATSAWKSTGKPPATYWHAEALSAIGFDGCGPAASLCPGCDMTGVVPAPGDHDNGEVTCGPGGTPFESWRDAIESPTICLKTSGSSTPNGWDLTGGMLSDLCEIGVAYDVYEVGWSWALGVQCYPVAQFDGTPAWGEVRYGDVLYHPIERCVREFAPLLSTGLLATSNESGIPDSVRIVLVRIPRRYDWGCSPYELGFFDDVSLAVVRAPSSPALGTLTVRIGQWINDTFPFNDDDALPGTAAFDTCAALLKTGINIAPLTGDLLRFDVPADTTVIAASGDGMRLDLVFRILPGPGNYVVAGNRSSGLRRVPTSAVAAPGGDGSFWGEYLANAGEFGTPGGHPGGTWSADVWNSARCDTAERNLFPVLGGGKAPGPSPGLWATVYHDDDPKFATLGILKNRCFLVDPDGLVESGNITCGEGTYPPAWVTSDPEHSGYSGTPQTREYTKILPDGLLTPGSHVQYFVRKSALTAPAVFAMVPDTQYIVPQPGEGPDYDGHRWQRFMVLPNRWRSCDYGGVGCACALYVDAADRRGEERAFMGIMDSTCGGYLGGPTEAPAGWKGHALTDYWGVAVGANPSIAQWKHVSMGSWVCDVYAVKGAESSPAGSLGSRLANTANMGLLAGKQSKQGPTSKMLRTYYRMIWLLSGDLMSDVLGPVADRSQDDIGLLRDFLTNGADWKLPRGLFAMGSGFVGSEYDAGHEAFLHEVLGVDLRDWSYYALSQNPDCWADLIHTSVISYVTSRSSVRDAPCVSSNEVFNVSLALPGATVATYYENVGVNGPYVASVYVPSSTTHPYITLVDGWDMTDLNAANGSQDPRRALYFRGVFLRTFASLCPIALPSWGCDFLDVPPDSLGTPVDFVSIRNNPLVSGAATIELGLARADRVQAKVYDIAGRLVRTVADREFRAGTYALSWDGTDDQGRRVAHGVYFTSVRFARGGFHAERKLTILR